MSLRISVIGRVVLGISLMSIAFVACPMYGQATGLEESMERARSAQSSGNYAEAASAYARATTLAPATPELWSNRGVMEYLAGEMEASIVSSKHALRLNPKMYIPMLFLGKAYVQTGQPGLALPYLTRAKALEPKDPEVLVTLAKADAAAGHRKEAETEYTEATRSVPDNAAAWLGLGSAALKNIATDGHYLAETQRKSVWAQALFADELLTQARPLEAMDKYQAALAAASPDEKARIVQTVNWQRRHPELSPLPGKSQEALQHLDDELQAGGAPTNTPQCGAESHGLEGAACSFWAGDYELSAKAAGEALQHSPKSAEALYWSIKAEERIAVASLARFEELAPHSAASYVMVGDLFRDQRQIDSALDEYRKALAIDPHSPGALLGVVVADFSVSNLDEATAMNQVALSDRPDDPQLNLLMAEILAAADRYEEARPYLAKCANAPPELQPRMHLLLGKADAKAGKTEEAIREYELALVSDEDGSVHFQLSRLYRKTGNAAKAQKAEAEAKTLLAQRRANAVVEVREEISANP